MDIQKTISDLAAKIGADSSLLKKFKGDPIATVKSLLGGVSLDDGALKSIVDGLKAKLKIDDVSKEATGFLA